MIFDGPNLLIILEASDGDLVRAIDIYSRWKDWVRSSVGSAYPEAFTTIGGEGLGGGLIAGQYFFLNTLSGWSVRPREASHELTIQGNLYPNVPGADQFTPTLGSFQVAINLQTSSLTQQVTADNLASLTVMVQELWQRHGLDPSNPAVFSDGAHRVPADGTVIDQTEVTIGTTTTVTRVGP